MSLCLLLPLLLPVVEPNFSYFQLHDSTVQEIKRLHGAVHVFTSAHGAVT